MKIITMNGKEMKKIVVLFFLLTISCCKKNQITGDIVPMHFSAGIETTTVTKTELAGTSSGWTRSTFWLPLDSIFVTNGTSASKFINVSESKSSSADFEGVISSGSSYIASYPYSSETRYAASSLEITLPDVQTYFQDGISSDCAPMVAKSDDNYLSFKNLCGILVLKLTGINTVSSVTFCGKDSNGKLIPVAGKGTVSTIYSTTPELVMDASAETSVKLNCPESVVLNLENPTTFHIVLPPAIYNTFVVTIEDVSGEVFYLYGTKPLTVKRSELVTAKSVEYASIETIERWSSYVGGGEDLNF